MTLPRSSPPVTPLYPYVRYDLYGRRPLAAHEPELPQLPSASAGGADPVSSGASVSPDHLITTTMGTHLMIFAACRLPGSLCLLLRCYCCRAAVGLPAIVDPRTLFSALGPRNGCNGATRVANGSQLSQLQLLVPIGAQDVRTRGTTPDQLAQDAARRDCGPAEWGVPRATGDDIHSETTLRLRQLVQTMARSRHNAAQGAVRAGTSCGVTPGAARARGHRVLRVAAPETKKTINANWCSCCRCCFPKGNP